MGVEFDAFSAFKKIPVKEDNLIRSSVDDGMDISSESFDSLDGFLVPDDERISPLLPRKRQRISIDRAKSKASPLKKSVEITNLTAKCKQQGSFHIIGRCDEVDQMIELIDQPNGSRSVLLVGQGNIGKGAIVKKFAESILNMTEMQSLSKRPVIKCDCQGIMSNYQAFSQYSDAAELIREKISKKILRHSNNPIIYFRHINAFLADDNVKEFFKSFLNQPFNFIASISSAENSEETLEVTKMLAPHHFKSIVVSELSIKHIPTITKQVLQQYPSNYKNIVCSDEVVDFATDMAHQYIKDIPAPFKVVDLIGRATTRRWMSNFRELGDVHQQMQLSYQDIAEIISHETGIDVQDLTTNAWEKLERIQTNLKSKIIGQDPAIEKVCRKIEQNCTGLNDPEKPAGSFLFVDPTGVGKTMLARELANELNRDRRGLVRINMEQYTETGSLSKLIGTSAGYVGYGNPGTMDRPIKRNPKSIILLDEIEKAHPEIIDFLLGLLDTGIYQNGAGENVDCREAIIIMTSNVGANELMTASKELLQNEKKLMKCLENPLADNFKPEFRNRLEVVYFSGFDEDNAGSVVEVALRSIEEVQREKYDRHLSWDKKVLGFIASKPYDRRFGMRRLAKNVQTEVAQAITGAFKKKLCLRHCKLHLYVSRGELMARIT